VQCSASDTCLGFWQRYGGNEYGLLHKDGSRTWRAGLPNGSVTEVWVQSGDCGTAPEVPAEPEVPETPESSCSYSPGEIQNAEYVDFSITSYEDAVVQCSASETCLGFWQRYGGNEYGLLHKDGSRTWRAGLPNGSVTEVWVQSEDCGTNGRRRALSDVTTFIEKQNRLMRRELEEQNTLF